MSRHYHKSSGKIVLCRAPGHWQLIRGILFATILSLSGMFLGAFLSSFCIVAGCILLATAAGESNCHEEVYFVCSGVGVGDACHMASTCMTGLQDSYPAEKMHCVEIIDLSRFLVQRVEIKHWGSSCTCLVWREIFSMKRALSVSWANKTSQKD